MLATKLGCTLLAMTLVACNSEPTLPGELVVALESMPQNLDPRFATDAASSRISALVFRGLTRPGRQQEPTPDIALDWKKVSDQVIEFELRRDVTFSDGRPLTSRDVKATYDSILDQKTASPKRETLAFLEGVDAPDRWTVRFRMRERFAGFLDATTIGILPESGPVIGAGPYRVARLEPDHEIRLEATDKTGRLPVIRFRIIPDDTTRALELKKGTLHLVQNGVEPENLEWLDGDPRLCVDRSPGTNFQYVGINMRDPYLSRPEVRRAIAHAIDRDRLITHLLAEGARPANGLLPPSHWAYEEDLSDYLYEPQRSRELLEAAGFRDPDGEGPLPRFRLSYKTTTLASRRRLAEALQAMLGEVGIGLDIESYEWGTFYGDVKRGSFQLYGLAWVGVRDPDFFHSLLRSHRTPPRGNNRGFFSHPEIDRLAERGRRTYDPGERREIYARLQQIVARELPFVPLWWEDVVVVQDRRLCGFRPTPSGDFDSLANAWWTDAPPDEPGGPCGCRAAR